MLAAVDGCAAPVVAGIHGYALGGGSGLAACADVVVAAPDAVFGFTEVRLGIAPAVISPFVLAKIGARARRYFRTGERFDADTALRIGLVDEVADDVTAQSHVSSPTCCSVGTRRRCARPSGSSASGRPARRGTGDRSRRRCRAGDEGQEGLRAFSKSGYRRGG